MFQIIFLMILFLCTWPALVKAELVILKNGTAVTGKIIERDDRKMKLEVNGVPMTYYIDEVEVIDGVIPAKVEPITEAANKLTSAQDSQTIPSEESKKDLILKFIDVFGTRSALNQNFDQLIKSASPAQALEIQKGLNIDELIDGLVPIYDKYFTSGEMQSYINFYSSPEGRKLVETIPHVMTDSVGVSLKYFKTKLPSIPAQEAK